MDAQNQSRQGSTPASGQRWPRISLRMSIWLVTAICLTFAGLFGSAHRQRRHVATIERAGGIVLYESERFPQRRSALAAVPWLGRDFSDRPVKVEIRLAPGDRATTDKVLRSIRKLPSLTGVVFTDRDNLTGSDLYQLHEIPSLEIIGIRGRAADDQLRDEIQRAFPGWQYHEDRSGFAVSKSGNLF